GGWAWGEQAEAVFAPYVEALRGPRRRAAADALVRMGGASAFALARALNHKYRELRLEAVAVLGRIGPPARAAVTPLLEAMLENDHDYGQAAQDTLAKIDPRGATSEQARAAGPALGRGAPRPLARARPGSA